VGAQSLGDKALSASWRLGNGSTLRIDLNLGADAQAATLPAASQRLFDSADSVHPDTALAPYSCVVSLVPAKPEHS